MRGGSTGGFITVASGHRILGGSGGLLPLKCFLNFRPSESDSEAFYNTFSSLNNFLCSFLKQPRFRPLISSNQNMSDNCYYSQCHALQFCQKSGGGGGPLAHPWSA